MRTWAQDDRGNRLLGLMILDFMLLNPKQKKGLKPETKSPINPKPSTLKPSTLNQKPPGSPHFRPSQRRERPGKARAPRLGVVGSRAFGGFEFRV